MELSSELDEILRIGPDFLIKVVAAIVCGGIVGLEREMQGKAAGLRTCIMVCIGSTIFTVLSVRMAAMFGGDATRIASQILPGIGFLGAGVIIREFGRGIMGLTTAAIIWVVAGLGMMVGANLVILSVGLAVVIVLTGHSLRRLEQRLHARNALCYCLMIRPDTENGLIRVQSLMTIFGHGIRDLEISEGKDGTEPTTVRFCFVGSDDERFDFLKLMYDIPGVDITR